MKGSIILANCTYTPSDTLELQIRENGILVLEMYDQSRMMEDDEPNQCVPSIADLERMAEILPKVIQQYKEYKVRLLIDPHTPIPEIFKSE